MISPIAFARAVRALAHAGALLCAGALSAQTTTLQENRASAAPPADTAASLVPLSLDAPGIPLATLGAAEIERAGIANNVLDVLRRTMPQFTGDWNLGRENASTGAAAPRGGSALALRNLPTLVLINGRRAATSAAVASGSRSFVDLNLIPVSAIERIEVLGDGASASHGSDAIGGVVNIVLKRDYQGFALGGHYGFSDNTGRWSERSAWLAGGASNGSTSLSLSAEWSKTDPLFQSERAFSSSLHDTTTFPGVISVDAASKNYRADGKNYYLLNPALTRPSSGHQDLTRLVSLGVYSGPYTDTEVAQSFNRAEYGTLLQGSERRSASVSIEHKLAPDFTLFGELLYARTETFSQSEAQPFTATLAATAAANPTDTAITAYNRLVDYPRRYFNDTESVHGVAGIRGKVSDDITWEVAAQQHEVTQDSRNTNLLETTARATAVANGSLILTARAHPDDTAENVLGTAYSEAATRLTVFDGVLRARVFDLPGGPVQIALSGQIQRESLTLISDRNSSSTTFGWDGGPKIDPVDVARSVKSVALQIGVPIFGREASVPFGRALSFDVALRRDAYSDTHAPTTPKYSLRWQPFNAPLFVRGSFSRSFAVPTLYQLHGPIEIGQTNPLTLATYDAFGNATGKTITGQAQARTGANATLAPSTAENFTTGIAYKPRGMSGLSLSADYFHVNHYNIVGTAGVATILASVEKLGTSSPYFSRVRIGKGGYSEGYFDGGTEISDEGKISTAGLNNVFVSDQNINLGAAKLDGIDLAASYTRTLQGNSRLDVATRATIYNHYRVRVLADTPYEEYSNRVTGKFNAQPDWRSYTTLAYSRGGFGVSLAHSYIPSMEDINGVTSQERYIESYSQFDVQAAYAFGSTFAWLRGTKLTLGMENVLNKFGPQSPSNTQSGVDLATYGAVGRKFYVGVQHKF